MVSALRLRCFLHPLDTIRVTERVAQARGEGAWSMGIHLSRPGLVRLLELPTVARPRTCAAATPAVVKERKRYSRSVVKGLERTVVGPGHRGRVQSVVGGALGLGLCDQRVPIQVRVPREGPDRDRRGSSDSSIRGREQERGASEGLRAEGGSA